MEKQIRTLRTATILAGALILGALVIFAAGRFAFLFLHLFTNTSFRFVAFFLLFIIVSNALSFLVNVCLHTFSAPWQKKH